MTSPTSISIPKLRADVSGRVIGPDDAEYDRARAVFYGGFDLYPAVIVQVADEVDIARVIALARETGLELAVKSGGHSVIGQGVSDGGIVIDLAGLRAIDVDAEERTAWAQTGLTALEFTTATHAHGLGVGFGDTGSVGIGGITLGPPLFTASSRPVSRASAIARAMSTSSATRTITAGYRSNPP